MKAWDTANQTIGTVLMCDADDTKVLEVAVLVLIKPFMVKLIKTGLLFCTH